MADKFTSRYSFNPLLCFHWSTTLRHINHQYEKNRVWIHILILFYSNFFVQSSWLCNEYIYSQKQIYLCIVAHDKFLFIQILPEQLPSRLSQPAMLTSFKNRPHAKKTWKAWKQTKTWLNKCFQNHATKYHWQGLGWHCTSTNKCSIHCHIIS